MSALTVRVARGKALAGCITIERQKDTCYPCYLVKGPSGSAWIEQPSGRRNGWCVSYDRPWRGVQELQVDWCGDFAAAKQYALEVVK